MITHICENWTREMLKITYPWKLNPSKIPSIMVIPYTVYLEQYNVTYL